MSGFNVGVGDRFDLYSSRACNERFDRYVVHCPCLCVEILRTCPGFSSINSIATKLLVTLPRKHRYLEPSRCVSIN